MPKPTLPSELPLVATVEATLATKSSVRHNNFEAISEAGLEINILVEH